MKQLKKYFKVVHELYDYFDYSSDGKIIPLEDFTDFYWSITKKPQITNIIYSVGVVSYHDEKVNKEDEFDWSESIEAVYIGEEYTMLHVIYDDKDNNNGSLCIFDNKKKIEFDNEI